MGLGNGIGSKTHSQVPTQKPTFLGPYFQILKFLVSKSNFSKLVEPRFIYFYLISVKDYFSDNAVGATVKSLRRRHFTDLDIPLPPLDIQREIVKRLDAAFKEIDSLSSQIRMQMEFIDALSQSFLSTAFTFEEEV